MIGFLQALSKLFGWVYSTLWSASFYPQVLLNLRRQSTAGTTIDFSYLNVVGFFSYLTSSLALYYDPVTRTQFAARNRGFPPTVRLNDIVFALHGLVLSLILVTQYLAPVALWSLPVPTSPGATNHNHNHNHHRPSHFAVGLTAGAILSVLAISLLAAAAAATQEDAGAIDPAVDWCRLDVVYALGYVKIAVTLVKYAPQLLANARHRSTDGWSVVQILLDLAGGCLSLAQQALDSYLLADWSALLGNPAKLALAQVSIFFDVLFILQHYVLYRSRHGRRNSNNNSSNNSNNSNNNSYSRRHAAIKTAENRRLLSPDRERRLD